MPDGYSYFNEAGPKHEMLDQHAEAVADAIHILRNGPVLQGFLLVTVPMEKLGTKAIALASIIGPPKSAKFKRCAKVMHEALLEAAASIERVIKIVESRE